MQLRAPLSARSVVPLALFLLASTAGAAPPPDFQTELVVSGLSAPMSLVFLPDDRALILQKGGTIRVLQPGAAAVDPVPYMTITDIESQNERGLIDITLDPDFGSNGFFYLYYTKASAARNRVSRFTEVGGLGDLSSEVVVWEDNENWSSCCHFGGGLDFGPDGALYLTTGEEFDGNQAQDLTRSGGKVHRFNPDGTIPADNPFIDGPGGAVDSIWALGLRNPFRARWDLPTSRFLIAEVGGNNQGDAWEDVHLGVAGANYGWPACEGFCSNPVYTDPIFTYAHAGSGASIIGGPVYRGGQFPSTYDGVYFYGDYVRGWIRYLVFDDDGHADHAHVLGSFDFETAAGSVVALEVGPEGSLYFLEFSGNLRRVSYALGNERPVITLAAADVTSGPGPSLTVSFSGAATDDGPDPLAYTWIFGDGQSAALQNTSHTYTSKGPYTARLEVSDGVHVVVSDPIDITVGTPPVAMITAPLDGSLFRAGDAIPYSATATDADGVIVDADFTWSALFLHNEHTHPGFGPFAGVREGVFDIPIEGHDYADATGYALAVTVTDSDGLTTTETVSIFPDKVDVTFDTVPSGLTLLLDDLPRTTPFVHDTVIGFRHTVAAPTPRCDGAEPLAFLGWSDGGAAEHVITVPDTDAAFTATYAATAVCAARVSGAIVEYHFDEGVGDTVFDVSGFGAPLDLTIADEAAVAWLPGGGLDVQSSTVVASAGAAAKIIDAVRAANELSVEAWVRPANLTQFGPARILALTQDPYPNGGNLVLGQTRPDAVSDAYDVRLRTTTSNTYGIPSLTTPQGLAGLVLAHVLYTRDVLGVARIYVDGALVAQGTAGGSLDAWGDGYALALANEPTGDRPWLGELHLVAIYDRALSAAEVDRNFQAGPTAMPAAPSIDVQPLAVTVQEAQTATFSVTASGSQPLVYQWKADGADIPGAAAASYTTPPAVLADSGIAFSCVVSNALGSVESIAATLTVVEPVNIPPVALADTYAVETGGTLVVAPPEGVLSNDGDSDGDALTAVLVSGPASGVLALAPDGSFTYTHDGGAATTDTFSYAADDGEDASLPVVVTIRIGELRVTSGLLALYTFLEGGGSTVGDVSGIAPPLDLAILDTGSTTWLPGGGLSVDAPTALRSSTAATKINGAIAASGALTLEAWLRPARLDLVGFGPGRIVALSVDPSNNGGNCVLGQNSSGASAGYDFRLRSTATNKWGTPSLATALGTLTTDLTHVALARDAAGATRIYLDGVLAASGATGGALTSWGDYVLALANEPTVDRPWLGELHLVAFYDRALDESEIAQNFLAGPITDGNAAPIASFSADPGVGGVPLTVDFDASSSTDGDGSIVSWIWSFGDGGMDAGELVSHEYLSTGDFTVELTVTDDGGKTASASLVVTVEVAPTPPAITAHPQSLGVMEGQPATFDVAATGSAPLVYQWLRDDVAIAGANGTSYTLAAATLADTNATFTCVVTNDLGGVESDPAVLTVLEIVNQAPVAIDDVYNVAEGGTLVIDAAIGVLSNDSDPEGDALSALLVDPPLAGALTFMSDGSFVYDHIGPDASSDSFTYRAADAEDVSNLATVTITVGSQRVTDGQVLLYTFEESGGDTIFDVSGVDPPVDLSIQTAAAVSWPAAGGLSVDAAAVIVSAGPASKVINALTASNELTLEAWITPADIALLGFGPGRIVALSVDPYQNGGDLILGQSSDGVAAGYDVRLRTTATNTYGTPSTATALGSLTTQLTHVVFTRSAAGLTRLYLDGVEAASGTRGGTLANWASYVLALGNEPTGDRPWVGVFHLVAIYDRALSAAEVQLNFDSGANVEPAPPSIVLEPTDQTVMAGQAATFTVAADGTAPLGYQWSLDGVDIPGASSASYTTPPAVLADGGAQYSCRVANVAGAVTSRAATLTVLEPVNAPPVAVDDAYSVAAAGVLDVDAAIGVLANDGDPEGSPLAAVLVAPPSYGLLALAPDGSFTYEHLGGPETSDSFTYYADDASDPSNEATVTIVIGNPRVTTGLLALYTFEEAQGATVGDVSGIGAPLDLTIEAGSSARWIAGGGLAIDDVSVVRSDVAATKVIDAMVASNALTVEAWVRPTSLSLLGFGPGRIVAISQNGYPAGGNVILGQGGDGATASYDLRLRSSVTNQYGTPSIATAPGTLTTSLTHVVVTRDASGAVRIYLDGVLARTGTRGGAFGNWGSYVLSLGNEPTGDRPWTGEFHLVALYDRALSDQEVAQNFAAGVE